MIRLRYYQGPEDVVAGLAIFTTETGEESVRLPISDAVYGMQGNQRWHPHSLVDSFAAASSVKAAKHGRQSLEMMADSMSGLFAIDRFRIEFTQARVVFREAVAAGALALDSKGLLMIKAAAPGNSS